jgi:hypothetical protein
MLGIIALRARGWTDGMVKRLMPTPDGFHPNRRYPSRAPMRLWATERVEAIEKTEEFVAEQERAKVRSASSAKAIKTKRERMRQDIAQSLITVARLEADEVRRRAINHYNVRQIDRGIKRGDWDWREATEESDPAFLERITVNYIRHQLTRYEGYLDEVWGKVGVDEAKRLISQRVFAAIAEAYPHLAEECDRQFNHRFDWVEGEVKAMCAAREAGE